MLFLMYRNALITAKLMHPAAFKQKTQHTLDSLSIFPDSI
jgi:hypothetical protein